MKTIVHTCFSCSVETKRAEKERILSLQLQTSLYTSKQTQSYLLQPQTEQQRAPNQNCVTRGSQGTGSKRGGCIRASSTFPFPSKWEGMSGRAKKTSLRRWRSFSSSCTWTNALLLFTATAAGHLAAYSPSLNGGQHASSRLGRMLLATAIRPSGRGFKQGVCRHRILSATAPAAATPLHP